MFFLGSSMLANDDTDENEDIALLSVGPNFLAGFFSRAIRGACSPVGEMLCSGYRVDTWDLTSFIIS